jgi:DNA-binding response OmpR family regulator
MSDNVRRRILVLDDQEETIELVYLTLQEHYDVLGLCDPLHLYEVINVFEPDLLILDIMMPHVTGFQILEMLRRNPDSKALPVMILSAKSSPGTIKHGYRLGATLYLTKPFQPSRLLKNIQTQFEVHQPVSDRKSLEGNALTHQLEFTTAHHKGHLFVPDTLVEKATTTPSFNGETPII